MELINLDADIRGHVKAAYDLAGGAIGKSIPEAQYIAKGIDCAKLKKLKLLGSGTSNGVRVHWIKKKCAAIARMPEPMLVAAPAPAPAPVAKPKAKVTPKPKKRKRGNR